MLDLTLISGSHIEWNAYLAITQKALGRSLTDKLDERRDNVRCLEGFLGTLVEFTSPGENPKIDPGILMKHLSFTALLISTEAVTYNLMETVSLHFTSKETIQENFRLSIVSGTLKEWYDSIIECSKAHMSVMIRLFSNIAQRRFEGIGLQFLFYPYDKIDLTDGTYYLR